MSTLNVSNITDGTTTVGTSYVVNGSAKAWVNFNGTGTVAIRDSFNVGSLTDNGVGNYNVNFSSNMDNADYANPLTGSSSAGNNISTWNSGYNTTSYAKIYCAVWGVQMYDEAYVVCAVHGDLA